MSRIGLASWALVLGLSAVQVASAQSTTPAPTQDLPGAAPAGPPLPATPGPLTSSPGNAGPPNAPPRPQAPVNINPIQLSPREKDELKDIEAEYERFQREADLHDQRLRAIARREYDSRTAELKKRYADRIARTEADRRKRHGDAIALLEEFLKNHPNHEQFTPDATFRLADLYIDQADEEVEARLAAQETAGPGPGTPDLASITADYGKSTALWEDILTRFPNYRQTPSTLYLLAYYGKSKDERRSLQIFLALSCANKFKWNGPPTKPPTRDEALKRIERKDLRDPYADCTPYPGAETELVRHAWVRGVADYHFTIPGELDEAIAAYLKVANGGNDSRLYAESLYKLAWSYYKRDRLSDSIRRFDESIKLYDSIVAAGGQPPLELRDESIQYISVAFTDPWEGETETNPAKAFDRAQAFYKGRENEPHVRDVWVAMGKAFTELQAWDQAVDAYRLAIGPPWELSPSNPVVHQEIVNVFEAKGDKFAADAAAAELAIKYAPGTAWYAANEKDREAMDNQRRIAERALYAAARNTHSAATAMRKDYEASAKKDPVTKQDYLAMYGKAVDLYRTFIATYAESDYIYEFSFLEGEALYWSERYPAAIAQYKWVRDHRDLGTAYYIDAARSVVQSYEAEVAREVDAGKLVALKVPTVPELQALPKPWQAQPIPEIYLQLQVEYDNYQNLVADPKAAPQQGINAALISLGYLHIDDAIARFQKVMDKFCGSPEAGRAKDGILAIYEAKADFDAIEAINKRFIAAKCGDEKSIQLAISQNRSLNFSRADERYKKGEYAAAAEAFYRFYKTAPDADPDLPVALFNAAVSYKLADKPKTAIVLFKEFTEKRAKNFQDSPYFLQAMGLQAASYQAAFDYDNAVKTYLALYDTTKKAKRLGIKAPDPLPGEKPQTLEQIGLDAIYNAALASELGRDFKKAIELYTQYGNLEPDRRKKDRALWSIAGIYRQQGDINAMTGAFDRWRARFGRDPGNEDDYVQSFYDTAMTNKKKGRPPAARAAGQATIAAWKARGSIKNSRGAKLAGEWQLQFAEDWYTASWEPFQMKAAARTLAEAKSQSAQLEKLKAQTEDKYLALDPYGVVEYSMAAKVRFGDIQYGAAQKIADAPIPVPVARSNNDDVIAAYETQRDANLKKKLDEAKQQWSEVYDLAKKAGISNRWSRKALEDLGREFPNEYTPLRQEIIQGTEAP
ncbi:MAG TPA: tetratricopeptide repeat protein [Kofleriaceae bacterium]|jgi:tetratricopeptide (TPR) repeat protein|nr:tetratricopeptide repeat protein [Kofleriaceae bacterium]